MPLDTVSAVLCLLLLLLAPLALCGIALLNTGLGRSRSAAQSLLGALAIIAVAAIVFCMTGFSFAAYPGNTHYSLDLGSTSWNWIGARPLFLGGLHWTGTPASFAAALEALAAGFAALIPWGSGADRWRLGSVCLVTAVFAAFAFPVVTHWVWGGGWLATLGTSFHLGAGFIDPGGAATVQALGGLSALAVIWILGPRRTKFSGSSMPRAIPGHHMIYVLLGCLLLLPGWMAFNCLGAILFAGIALPSLVLVVLNTLLSAAAALLAAMLVTGLRFRKPDASLCANGWVSGLVVSSALAPYARLPRRCWLPRSPVVRCRFWSSGSKSTPTWMIPPEPLPSTASRACGASSRWACSAAFRPARCSRNCLASARCWASCSRCSTACTGCSTRRCATAPRPRENVSAWTCTNWAPALIQSL